MENTTSEKKETVSNGRTNGAYTVVIIGKQEWQDYVTEVIRALSMGNRPVMLKARGPNGAAKTAWIASFFVSNEYVASIDINVVGVTRTYDGKLSCVPEITALIERKSG